VTSALIPLFLAPSSLGVKARFHLPEEYITYNLLSQ
jgi:hypothetical protein